METNLPSATVQGYLEATGRLVVFRGYGGTGQQGEARVFSWSMSSQLWTLKSNLRKLKLYYKEYECAKLTKESRCLTINIFEVDSSPSPSSNTLTSHTFIHMYSLLFTPPWCSSGDPTWRGWSGRAGEDGTGDPRKMCRGGDGGWPHSWPA